MKAKGKALGFNGDPWGYTNWFPGQPDGAYGGIQHTMYYHEGDPRWDDSPDYFGGIPSQYIVEYTPEPATLSLLILGGLALLRRKGK